MALGIPPAPVIAGDPLDLLPLVFARPGEALAGARGLLASAPGPHDASIAHQVIGIWERDFGDLTVAVGHLRRARSLARRSGSADREADALAALGVAIVYTGRTAEGLRALDEGASRGDAITSARVLFRRGRVLWILGRHHEALDDLRAAVPVLRDAGDTIWSARALTLRGLVQLSFGATDQAGRDLAAAERLWELTDQDHDRGVAVWNRGAAAFRSGDLPTALRHLDEAARRFEALGTPAFGVSIDRCDALMAAGLAGEALQEADGATALLERMRGRAPLGQSCCWSPPRPLSRRVTPARRSPGPPRPSGCSPVSAATGGPTTRGWCCSARGSPPGLPPAGSYATSRRSPVGLAEMGSPQTVQASLLAGRVSLAIGWGRDADRHLAAAARGRHRGPALARADGWLAEALREMAAGRERGVLHACRRGLDALDEHRLVFGAAEPRALATAGGAELAALAQRVSLRRRDARGLLAWSERWRATALAVPPTRPPDDHELVRETAALREIAGRVESARSSGTPVPALEREQRRLERAIRGAYAPGAQRGHRRWPSPRRPRVTRPARRRLADRDRRRRRRGARAALRPGQGAAVPRGRRGRGRGRDRSPPRRAQKARVRAPRTAGRDGGAVRPAGSRRARLQDMLLGPALRHLRPGPLVVVPPGRMHGVPWAALPALRDQVLGVSPSAGAWLRAGEVPPPPGAAVVLVRGPGLATGGAEVPSLAPEYGEATVLEGGTATVSAVLKAIDGCLLAHIAAHGTFRADSPMFSSLRLADGRLTVHDLERLSRAPHRIVLPSCDSGVLAPVGADELLGLAAALLPLGTAGIVASVVPVGDEASVPLMVSLHEGLRAGMGMAEALREARRSTPPDPAHQASGWSFCAIGAA